MTRLLLAPTEIHRLRYVKNKLLGMSTEQLSKEEGISEKWIQQSIAKVEAYRALNTLEELEASQVEVVLFNKELEKMALRGSLQAFTEIRDDKGKVIERVPDHEIRLKGVEIIAKITDNLLNSKPAPIQPASQTSVNVFAGGAGGVGIATFEDRLREVKRKRGLLVEQNLPAIDVKEPEELEEFTPDWEGSSVEQSSP